MAKFQNTFSSGIINKDLQSRFVDSSEMIDAENFFVVTTQGSSSGVGKNALGNLKKTNLSILGAKTIGVGKNESKNKLYNFVKGTNHDYIIEYDTFTEIVEIIAQSSTGGVLNFKEGERILNVDIINIDENEGDFIAFSGDSNGVRLANVAKLKTLGIDEFSEDEISVMKPSPIFAPTLNLTTSNEGVSNNFIEEKFIRFAYRYKYNGGFYSAPGSWSKIAFEPKSFSLDYQTYENKGMVNLSNAVNVSFNTGSKDIIAIELLFRESNSNTIYVVQDFIKEKESWPDNVTRSFQLSKSKIFKILSEEQSLANFDNVPLSAVAQTTIMNRLVYANYIEGMNIDTDINFEAQLVSTNPYVGGISTVISNLVDTASYSNVVDFESGNSSGGSAPVDQMNYLTNEINVAISGASSGTFNIEITPKAGYSSVPYTITVKEGATVLQSWANITGNSIREYTTTSDRIVTIFVTSNIGIIYDCKLVYEIKLFLSTVSKYDYFATHQLSYPKSTGYLPNLEGDTIIKGKSTIDLSTYQFESGKQIRINFELQSSLVLDIKPSTTFFYNITQDYVSLADFIDNSSFKNQLEETFSLNFRNNFISNEGIIVSFVGFILSYSGTSMIIENPRVVYNVTEPSTIVSEKNEFFLTNEASFITVTENSFSSLHSNRDNEICMFYMDSKGRKTTSLVSKNNTIHVPAENSSMVNKVKVLVFHNPPTEAKYYKFGIKNTKRKYETIYGNEVYKDGIYRWIRLVGENKNKVKEGDILVVKSDYSGPLSVLAKTKVLEISMKDEDFIKNNKLSNGKDLIEQVGLYMKIKQGNFDVDIDQDSFQSFIGSAKRRYASRSFATTSPLFGEYEATVFVPLKINAGTQITFSVTIKAYGSIAFEHIIEFKNLTAQKDYASVQQWWEAEVGILNGWTVYAENYINEWQFDTDGKSFSVKPWRDGTATRDIMTDIVFDINFAGGTLVFETEAFEDLSSPFFETPETYTITNGQHEFVEHILNDAYDCYAFGNGVESYKITDSFSGKSFSMDSNPSEVSKEGYRKNNRYADITYSGIYKSSTNVNRLNEFNLATANFKDDIDKSYGPIYKIKGEETNLQVFQEDKDSQVFYGKNVLYNADGTANLSQIADVLGIQDLYLGDYGISKHPDSFDVYGSNSYHTDVKRGVVIKKSNNGLFEASSQGMRSYFQNLFRNNKIDHINGKYDQYNGFYILNIQYDNYTKYVTWVYSDAYDGWLGRMTFNPEDMTRIGSKFFAFKNGEVYEHNSESARNTFFGVEYPSKFTFNFSQNPSERKIYKNLEIEGTDAWNIFVKTDINEGYVNLSDFEKEEGVFYAYLRTSNEEIDSSLLSCQGIGNCTVNALVLSFTFDLDSVISVGDEIRNATLQLVGKVLSKTNNSLTLDAVNNISNGDYVLCSKPQSIENSGLLGYHMEVSCELNKTTPTEVFAVNTEVSKSYM